MCSIIRERLSHNDQTTRFQLSTIRYPSYIVKLCLIVFVEIPSDFMVGVTLKIIFPDLVAKCSITFFWQGEFESFETTNFTISF